MKQLNKIKPLRRRQKYREKLTQAFLVCVITGVCLTILPSGGVGTGAVLQWPVQEKQGLTSSFGEWRPGHVHAGVDIKTWGRIGVPLLAVDGGHIQRVRLSPWGYGKALYLKLDDGRMAVYGHMDRYIEEIEEAIWEKQHDELSYSVDLWFEPDEFPVARGDILGFSGVTGATAPHLHFELRDQENHPVNPLLEGLQIEDTTSPVIQFLIMRPVGTESRIEGDIGVRRFGVRSAGARRYRLHGRPEIEGSVGIAVVTYDGMDGVYNRFSPFRLQLEVDGEELFEVRYTSFSYLHSGLISLDRDYRYMVREGIRGHTLYRQNGNELSFYGEYEEGSGYLRDLAPGIHNLKVTVADALGNETYVEGEMLWNRPPLISLAEAPIENEETAGLAGSAEDPDGDALELALEVLQLGKVESGEPAAVRESEEDRGEQEESSAAKWKVLPREILILEGSEFRVSRALLDSLSAEGSWIVRARASDIWGSTTFSRLIAVGNMPHFDPGQLWLAVDRYEGFLVLTAWPQVDVPGHVLFTVRQGELAPDSIQGIEGENGRFEAVYPLKLAHGDQIEIQASIEPVSGPVRTTSTRLHITSLPASRGAVHESPDTGLRIVFEPGAVFEDCWIEEGPTSEVRGNEPQKLIPITDECLLGPEDILFRGSGELTMPIRALPDFVESRQVGLYTRDGQDERNDRGERVWFYLGGELEDDVLRGRIGGLGPFAVLADTSQPELKLLSPRDGSVLNVRRPRIAFEVDDNATGFSDEAQFVLRLNGKQVIAQYDPQRNRLVYVPRVPLDPGDYWMRLEAVDNAGNLGRVSSRFVVR